MFEFNFFFLVFFSSPPPSSSPLLISQFSASHLYFRWFYFFFPRSRRHTHWTHKNQLRPNTFDFFFSQYYFCFPFRFVAAQIVFYQFRIENRKGTSAKGQISTEPRMWNTEPINLFIWNNVFSSVFVSGSRNWRNSCSVTRGNCERIIRIPTMKTTATCRSSSNSSSSSDRSNRRTVAQQVSQPLS